MIDYQDELKFQEKQFYFNTGFYYNKIKSLSVENEKLTLDYKVIGDSVMSRTNELLNYIRDLKISMIKMTEGPDQYAITGTEIEIAFIIRKENRDVPLEMLIKRNQAVELKKRVRDYKIYLYKIVQNDSIIVSTLESFINTNDREIKIRLNHTEEWQSWETYTFDGMPLGWVINKLSQIQNDIRFCEFQVMTYLYSKINDEIERNSNKVK